MSWGECSSNQSNIDEDRLVATTISAVQAQILTIYPTGPDFASSQIAFSNHSSAQAIGNTCMPSFPIGIFSSIIIY